jgi:hypothetical protein
MNEPFDTIAVRRAALIQEIGNGREDIALIVQSLRKDFALASLGFAAGQLLGRKGWLRAAGVAMLALTLGRSLLARLLPARR